MRKTIDPTSLNAIHHRLVCAVNAVEAVAMATEYVTNGTDFLDGLYAMTEYMNQLLNELGNLYEGGSDNDR